MGEQKDLVILENFESTINVGKEARFTHTEE